MAFYTVFCPTGEAPAKVVHETHPAALFAAHAMAKEHPDKTFFVMKAASKAIVAPTEPTASEG